MALQGSFTYKGIDISSAYLVVSYLNYSKSPQSSENEVTAAVYSEEDGTLVTPAVYETLWSDVLSINCDVKVYKDSAAKTANPNEFITTLHFSFTPSIAADADNFVAQAYNHINSLDDYSDYTDV